MKKLISFLMLAFMLMLVAPTQAMQAGDDCNVSYNIDNCNAPPGLATISVGIQSDLYYFENCQTLICPGCPDEATQQNQTGTIKYAATSRDAVLFSIDEIYYSPREKHANNVNLLFTYRKPIDGLIY